MIKKLLILLLIVSNLAYAQQRTIENPPINLEQCDTAPEDGFSSFDLTSNNVVVTGSQDPADLNIAYFETSSDAQNANNPISSPTNYTNSTSFIQTVYVRVDELGNGSFDTAPFDLIVLTNPTISDVASPLEICDDNTDEIAIFNLTILNSDITLGDSSLTVSYYVSQNDLDNGLAIPNPSSYSNVQNPQTIQILVTNPQGCTTQTSVVLSVLPLPSPSTISAVEACDDDSDGFSDFDLTAAAMDIANGEANVTVTFHETQADADSNQSVLSSLYTNISAFNQTLFARDTNDITGCYVVIEVELVVYSSIAAAPTDLSLCDDNGNTIEVFDLTQNNSVVTGTQDPADLTITYHESQADLNNGIAITTPTTYSNTSNPQTMYVLVENAATGCSGEDTFDIEVDDCAMDDDGDGVPNDQEDLNNNDNLDDDDTDGDLIPNYLDDDDDGDLVLTQDEIEGIGAGRSAFIDTDMDSIENYLDEDDDGDGVLTKDEDYNENGDPLDDDTNANSIPDFLDEDVALGITDFTQIKVSLYPNPTHNRIHIESNHAFAKAELFNLQGQKVYALEATPQLQSQINISALPTGIYFLRLDGQMVGRIIKE